MALNKKSVELLASAGQWESLVAAIGAGGNVTLHPMWAAIKLLF